MKSAYRNWNDQTFEYYLEKLAVPANKPFRDFSRGMKMKLSIAVALSHGAKLLILDEATSGLDPVVRDELLDVFNEFTRNPEHSILISSHIVSDLEKICDYIAFLHKGRLMLCQEKDVLKEQYIFVHGTSGEIDRFDRADVIGRKDGRFGTEAIVRRTAVNGDMKTSPVSIEDLFVFMAKEENR